jgi:hypothetical protein
VADDADTAESAAALRQAHECQDGDPLLRNAPQVAMAEAVDDSGPVAAADLLSSAEAGTDRPARRDGDALADRTNRRAGQQTDHADDGDGLPESPSDAALAKASVAELPAALRIADQDVGADRTARRDAAQTKRPHDGDPTPIDTDDAAAGKATDGERLAEGTGWQRGAGDADAGRADRADSGDGTSVTPKAVATDVTAAVPLARIEDAGLRPVDKTAAAPADNRNARQTDRAQDAAAPVRQSPSGDADRPAADATSAGNDVSAADGRQMEGKTPDRSAVVPASSSKPAPAESDSAQIRYWARGDAAAALAAAADSARRPQSDAAPGKPQTVRQSAPSHGGDRPIDVRVAAYERHPAPPAAVDGTKAAAPTDVVAADDVAPASAPASGEAVDAAGSAEASRTARRRQGWQPLTFAARSGVPASATPPSDQKIAAQTDQTATPDAAKGNRPDRHEDRSAASTIPIASKTAEDRQPPVTGGSAAGSNPAATASASAAASTPPLAVGVASGIVSALNAARAEAGAQPAPTLTDPTGTMAAAEPVRSIALNLDLREYGRVDLRISLKGNAVSVQLKADRAETADALARDDATLRDVLHRAGYEAQQVQIDKRDGTQPRLGDAATTSGQQPAGGAGTGASSGHAAGGERAATPDQRPQARRDADGFALSDRDTQDGPRQDRYRGPDRLYV